MINKIERTYNLITIISLIIYSIVGLIFAIFMPKYNIFFPGWWTLLFIIPALGTLLFHKNKINSLYIIISGVLFFLLSNSIINVNKCFTILLCLGIIIIGINIVKATITIPEKKSTNQKNAPFYYTLLGATEEKYTGIFSGCYVKALIGSIVLDLRDCKIENNSTINVTSIFGETEILLPDNVEVINSNINVLGGTENLKPTSKAKRKTKVYIESTSILGGTKIK